MSSRYRGYYILPILATICGWFSGVFSTTNNSWLPGMFLVASYCVTQWAVERGTDDESRKWQEMLDETETRRHP